MKRDYSETTSASQSGHHASHRPIGSDTHVGGGDENVAPNHQAKAKTFSSSNIVNKPNPIVLSSSADVTAPLDKESIAKNTRAAIRRHALGDVSNVSTLNQVKRMNSCYRISHSCNFCRIMHRQHLKELYEDFVVELLLLSSH